RGRFDGGGGGAGGALEQAWQRGAALGGGLGRLGRPAGDGQDGAFDRRAHALVGGLAGRGQPGGEVGRRQLLFALEAFGEAAEQLRKDDPGVAARGQHGRLGGASGDLAHASGGGQRAQRFGGGAQGHRH